MHNLKVLIEMGLSQMHNVMSVQDLVQTVYLYLIVPVHIFQIEFIIYELEIVNLH